MSPFQLLALLRIKEKAASCTDIMRNEMYLQRMNINRRWACDERCMRVAV